MNFGRTALNLLVLSTGILAAVRSPLQGAETALRHGRISADDARVLNLADDKGKEVARPARGSLVAVYREHAAGWVEVEVPGGFPVWVFGRYLKALEEPGIYEITANAVNLRPEPSSDVTNFPLPQRLKEGDRVRGIEPVDPSRPLAETWVRVWSPPGVRGWLRASALGPLAPGEDGSALWSAALQSLPSAPPPRATVARPNEGNESEKKEVEARTALEEARAALERERARPTPDFSSVRVALNAVLARSPSGSVAMEARAELRSLETLEEAAVLKADLERERLRRQEEALRRQQDVWEKSREKDPLGEVFLARGVLERRIGTDGTARYFLRFGGETTGEVLCSSGRYDLSVFAGTEVGVHGSQAAARSPEIPTFEISRIEVIALR